MATAEKKPMNILQKLAQARLMFLNEHVKKSGKNIKLEFTYFELKDIVPSATRIFADLGIASIVNFDEGAARMELYNADNSDEAPVTFVIPYKEAPQIISNAGKEVTNPLQALGATITYLRRYLYMLALDIVEDDETDANLGSEKPAETKKPATAAERKKAKEQLTAPAKKEEKPAAEAVEMASPETMEKLKGLAKNLIQKDETKREFIAQIGMKTKGFTELPAAAATQLITHMEQILAEYEGKE